jgi:hypothetical protein
MKEVLDEEEHLNRPVNASDKVLLEYLGMENKLWINSKENLATKLASEANQKKLDLTPEQLVPREYHDYLDIFNEDKANWFPDTRPWDHKIEMKFGFEPKSFKTYNLTPENKWSWINFWKKIWTKDTSNRHNHLWHHRFSSSRKRMENFDPAKIIDI